MAGSSFCPFSCQIVKAPTANRIIDAADLTVAMEAITIGQLEAGDQAGALHTAKLISEEINRSGVLMHIAIAQARSGNVKGAIETANSTEDPLRRNAILFGIAFTKACQNAPPRRAGMNGSP